MGFERQFGWQEVCEWTRESKRTSGKSGGVYLAGAAIRGAAYGHYVEARQSAVAALKIAPASQGVAVEVAMAGDTTKVESSQDLRTRYPLDTEVQSQWLPTIDAQLAPNRRNPAEASLQQQRALQPIEARFHSC